MSLDSLRPRRIASHYLYTTKGFLRNAIVSLDRAGFITAIENFDNRTKIDSIEGVEFFDGLLVPGFVNAHCHLELSYLRGAISEGAGNAVFAAEIGVKRVKFDKEEQLKAAKFYDAKMWSDGIAAVGDICNSTLTFDLKSTSKINYTSFIELFGLAHHNTKSIEGVIDTAQKAGITFSVTPHSTYSLNEDAFNAAVGYNKSHNIDAALSIHFMESNMEAELFHEEGAMWEWYQRSGFECDFLNHDSPAQRIIKDIPSDQRIILVHNTFVNEEEIGLLQSHFGDRLTWVLCLRSNQYINRAEPPVDSLIAGGGRIALGTDSLASNHSLSMLDEMRELSEMPLEIVLGWATLNGAKALGIENLFGSIEVGKRPGISVLSGLDWSSMKLTPETKINRLF